MENSNTNKLVFFDKMINSKIKELGNNIKQIRIAKGNNPNMFALAKYDITKLGNEIKFLRLLHKTVYSYDCVNKIENEIGY